MSVGALSLTAVIPCISRGLAEATRLTSVSQYQCVKGGCSLVLLKALNTTLTPPS